MEEFIKSLLAQLKSFNAEMVDGDIRIKHDGKIYHFKYQLVIEKEYHPQKVFETVDGQKLYAQ